MQKSESIKELGTALSAAQAEFPAVKFNATNPFLKNKYADLGAIISAVKPILANNNLSVSQLVESSEDQIGVTSMLIHSSGEWIASTVTMETGEERGKSAAQVAGSIITYMRRYSLSSLLGIYADEDGDGNEPEQRKPVQQPAQQQAKPQPAKTQPSDDNSRPMPAETLKRKIQKKADEYVKKYNNNVTFNDKQVAMLRYALDLCFEADPSAENKRHQVLKYLTGGKDGSTKTVKPEYGRAMLDWLSASKKDDGSGDYEVPVYVAQEAALCDTAAQIENGQENLI